MFCRKLFFVPLTALAFLMCVPSAQPQDLGHAHVAAAVADTNAAIVDPASAFDYLEIFGGLDGSKQPQDLGINANMGIRLSVNAGIPLLKRTGLGAQVGAAINLSDAAVHVLDQIDGTSRRTQTYLTLGLFQRVASRLSWAAGYDLLHQQYYDTFNLGQLRGQVGYEITRTEEIGARITAPLKGDRGVVAETAVNLRPIAQVNGYYRRIWPSAARTTLWAGVAGEHHNVVLVFPDNSKHEKVFMYGAQLEMPLSDRLSVTGSGNFVTPTATGTVDAYLGVTFYPGRKSASARRQFAPAMFVSNNPEFPVDLNR